MGNGKLAGWINRELAASYSLPRTIRRPIRARKCTIDKQQDGQRPVARKAKQTCHAQHLETFWRRRAFLEWLRNRCRRRCTAGCSQPNTSF